MIKRFDFSEQIRSQLGELSLEQNINPAYITFRLLAGLSRFEDGFYSKVYSPKIDYFSSPYALRRTPAKKADIFENFSDEVTLSELSKYFKSLRQNKAFYNKLQSETIECLIAREQGRFLESFVYAYRMLEGISYTFPLIYTSKASSFERSFSELKDFMSKSKTDGELAFFKRFINAAFSTESFFQTTVDVKFSSIEIDSLRASYFRLLKTLMPEKQRDIFILDETEDYDINYSFLGFLTLVISVRNRYLHFLQGSWSENISSQDLVAPNLFFSVFIDEFINWLAVIILEILKFDMGHSQR